MKRLLSVIALFAALAPSVSAAAAPRPLTSELLSSKNLNSQWSRYYIERQDTSSCPEYNFSKPSSPASARTMFVNESTGTLLLEKLGESSNPVQLYNTLVTRTLKCPKTGSKLDGQVTFQQIHPMVLTGVAEPHRAFTLHAVVGGATVTGCVVYARKGSIVVAFAELSVFSLSQRQFKAAFATALKKTAA
jgi:hypothetical protein